MPQSDERETARTLLRGSLLEPGRQLSWHPSAVFTSMPAPWPRAHLGGVQPAARRPTSGTGWPPGAAPGPPCGTHIRRQRVSQRPGMLGVQVDLVLRAVQAKADSIFSLSAIQVIDEQDLYLLSQG